MSGWEPTIGKWDDIENFDIQTPIWRRMLNTIAEYDDFKNVFMILKVLGNWNITGDEIRQYVIGYAMVQKELDLKLFVSEDMIRKINYYSSKSSNIHEYTKRVLKECHVSEAVIDEMEFED